MRNAQLKVRLHLACLFLLTAGLCSAALICALADDVSDSGQDYIVVSGVAYPVAPQTSKRYVRTLEQFGGKASVLFDEFNRWFESLWRGRRLALTIACLSTLGALALFLFARWLPADED